MVEALMVKERKPCRPVRGYLDVRRSKLRLDRTANPKVAVTFNREDFKALKKLATARGKTFASVVRAATQHYIRDCKAAA